MNFRWAVTEISLVFIIQVSLHKGYTILILGGVGRSEPLDNLLNTAGEIRGREITQNHYCVDRQTVLPLPYSQTILSLVKYYMVKYVYMFTWGQPHQPETVCLKVF